MTKTITGVLVDAERAHVERATIPATLDSYYEHLDCTTIDIVSRTIGGKRFDIICDDEALLRDNPILSALDSERFPMLYGNLFVCKSKNGELVSLTDREVSHVLRNAGKLYVNAYFKPIAVIAHVDY